MARVHKGEGSHFPFPPPLKSYTWTALALLRGCLYQAPLMLLMKEYSFKTLKKMKEKKGKGRVDVQNFYFQIIFILVLHDLELLVNHLLF